MSELSSAIKQICEEKNLDYDTVVGAIELALAAAYRKDYGEKNQNIKVDFDPQTGKTAIFDVKTVVENLPEKIEEEMRLSQNDPKESGKIITIEEATEETEAKKFNPRTEIQVKEAMIMKHSAVIGEEILTELPIPESYGRMAAQTAKQVIVQKLREMERDMVLREFKDKEKEVIGGIIQRREGRFVLVDLGKAIGILPLEEQIYNERYNPGERIKVYVKEVKSGPKGPEIILSRKSEEILKKIFYLEIPEISNGLVELKAVAREAGSRSKVAIYTEAENVDPVGSCVGQRGARIQTIINELGGEKVDIIEYSEDPAKFVANALSPAKIISIEVDDKQRKAVVKVSPDKLSLAIGKNGQNVRLAAHLTGWKIDIIEASDEGEKKVIASDEVEAESEAVVSETLEKEVKDMSAVGDAPAETTETEAKPKKTKTVKAKAEAGADDEKEIKTKKETKSKTKKTK